jgi:hypothetical protein
MGTTAGKVLVALNLDVSDFLERVEAKFPKILHDISSLQLKAYKNKISFDSKEDALEEDASIAGLGRWKHDALLVVVPSSSAGSSPSSSAAIQRKSKAKA